MDILGTLVGVVVSAGFSYYFGGMGIKEGKKINEKLAREYLNEAAKHLEKQTALLIKQDKYIVEALAFVLEGYRPLYKKLEDGTYQPVIRQTFRADTLRQIVRE